VASLNRAVLCRYRHIRLWSRLV